MAKDPFTKPPGGLTDLQSPPARGTTSTSSTNPWDNVAVAPAGASATSPTSTAANQPSFRAPTQNQIFSSQSRADELNRRFAGSTAHHRNTNELEKFRLREDLSAGELQRFLGNLRGMLNSKGELLRDQKLEIPLFGESTPRVFSTSDRSNYGATANDAGRVLTQAEISYLVLSTAQQLQERFPEQAKKLLGLKAKDELMRLGDGTADGTISTTSLDSEKSRYEMLQILGDAQDAAAEAQSIENPDESIIENESAVATDINENSNLDDEDDERADRLSRKKTKKAVKQASESGGSESKTVDAEIIENQPEPELDIDISTEQLAQPQPELDLDTSAQQLAQPKPEPELDIDVSAQAPQTPILPASQPQPTDAASSPSSNDPLSQPLADNPQLVELLVEKFSFDYAGSFVAASDIPDSYKQDLSAVITEHLSKQYSPLELEKLSYSPTLYKKAVEKLHLELKTSPVSQSTRALLEKQAQNPGLSKERRQQIQEALQSNSFLQVSTSDNPYQDFVRRAGEIIGPENNGALFAANAQLAESSLEASIITIGEERTRKLLENASPEQLRNLLNIPAYVSLTPEQLGELRFSAVALVQVKTAQLVFASQAPQLRDGLYNQQRSTTPGTGTIAAPSRSILPQEQADKEGVEALGKNGAQALTQKPRDTKAKLDKVQKMLQGSWDSLGRKLQQQIYEDNGISLPQNHHPEDTLPYTTAFVAYSQTDVDRLRDWLEKRGVANVAEQEQLLLSFQSGGDFYQAQADLIETEVISRNLRREFLNNLDARAAYAIRANALASLDQFGNFGIPDTAYLSPEDVALLSDQGLSDADLSSFYELQQSADYLSDNPESYQNYMQAYWGNQSGAARFRQPLQPETLQRSRTVAARAQALAQTGKRIQELRKLGTSLIGTFAGSPVSAAQLAAALLTTDTGRKVLAGGAALAALPLLPGLALLMNGAGWWQSATSGIGNAWSAMTGGGGGAASGAAGASGGATASAGSGVGTGSGVTGSGAGGAGGTGSAAAGSPTLASSTRGATSAGGDLGVGGQGATGPIPFSGTAVQTTGFNIFASFSGATFASTTGFIIFSVFMVLLVINAAFLIPSPSLLPGTDPYDAVSESKYAFLTKTAKPKQLPNDQFEQVGYSIEFGPKPGYVLEVTDITDLYSFLGEGDISYLDGTNPELYAVTGELDPLSPDGVNASPSASKKITSPITLETFGTDKIDSVITRRYQQTLRATDTLVLNTVKITFNVYDEEGTLLKSGEVLANSAGVRIGNPKTACWPTSGTITQGPKSGTSTHQYTEAFDIGAPSGTRIYAPYPGKACNNVYTVSPTTGYGNHVVIAFDYNGIELKLVFSHMVRKTDLGPTGCKDVSEGEFIGEVGTTGNSTGNHLHYELRKENLPSGLSIRDLIFNGNTAQVGDVIKSCYE